MKFGKVLNREAKTRVAQRLREAITKGEIVLKQEEGGGIGYDGVQVKRPYEPVDIPIATIKYPERRTIPIEVEEQQMIEDGTAPIFDEAKREGILEAIGFDPGEELIESSRRSGHVADEEIAFE